jgi:oligopeptide/dipeptide ABC transporter ATP-binding protein
MTQPLVEVRDLVKHFPITQSFASYVRREGKDVIHAVDHVSLEIQPGEALGLIGESGSGKTTLGWLIARLHDATSGQIFFDGQEITGLKGSELRAWRRHVQVVFQDPVGSLDPRLRVWQIVGEPIRAQEKITKAEVRDRVTELLRRVGLPEGSLDQYPHEFSGGGRQRLSLARALALNPRLVVLDEPTSALDVAVQAQILNQLVSLQRERGFAYLLITHHVGAVRYVSDRVAVMYLGKIAEVGEVRQVLEHPVHPYTKALLAALPEVNVRRRKMRYRIGGEIPTLVHPPPGCRFAPRCPFVIDRCRTEEPALRTMAGEAGRLVACHRAEEVASVPPADLIAPMSAAPVAEAAPPKPEDSV